MESLPSPEEAREEAGTSESEASSKNRTKRKSRGRLPIPTHFERVIIDLDVPEENRVCLETGKPMVIAGYEESEKIEYRPGRLFVNVYRRPKYVSPDRINGSERGGRAAALYLGLLQSCKACDVNPWKYFDDIFRRIMSHPANRRN